MGLGQGYIRDIFTSQRALLGDNFLQKVDRLGSGCVSQTVGWSWRSGERSFSWERSLRKKLVKLLLGDRIVAGVKGSCATGIEAGEESSRVAAEQRSNDGGSVGEFAFEMRGRAYLVNHKSGGPLSTSVPRGASFNN